MRARGCHADQALPQLRHPHHQPQPLHQLHQAARRTAQRQTHPLPRRMATHIQAGTRRMGSRARVDMPRPRQTSAPSHDPPARPHHRTGPVQPMQRGSRPSRPLAPRHTTTRPTRPERGRGGGTTGSPGEDSTPRQPPRKMYGRLDRYNEWTGHACKRPGPGRNPVEVPTCRTLLSVRSVMRPSSPRHHGNGSARGDAGWPASRTPSQFGTVSGAGSRTRSEDPLVGSALLSAEVQAPIRTQTVTAGRTRSARHTRPASTRLVKWRCVTATGVICAASEWT